METLNTKIDDDNVLESNRIEAVVSELESSLSGPFWQPTDKVLQILNDPDQIDFKIISFNEQILNSALAEYCKVNPDYIQTYAGSNIALETICRRYLKSGTEILISSPTTGDIIHYANSYGVQISRHYGTSPFSVDIDGLISKVNENTRLIFIGNPSQPSGTVLSESEAEYLLDNAGNATVIIDESSLIFRSYSLSDLVNRYQNLIVVRSFDGAYGMDSYSFAFLLSHPDNLNDLNRSHFGYGPDLIAQIAVQELLTDMDRIDDRIDNIHENMILLSTKLRARGISCRLSPTGSLLVKSDNPGLLTEQLEMHGVYAISCENITQLEEYIIIPVKSDEYSFKMIEIFDNICKESVNSERTTRAKLVFKKGSSKHPVEVGAELWDQ